jgi:NADH:ubiquinone oxidoreductase subunit 6 (subunit J)
MTLRLRTRVGRIAAGLLLVTWIAIAVSVVLIGASLLGAMIFIVIAAAVMFVLWNAVVGFFTEVRD